MANDTRGGVLRGARTTTGVSGQDTRGGMGREGHLSRGTTINYQKDLGISSSEDQASAIRAQDSTFNNNVSEQQGKINSAQSQLQGQYGAGKSKIDAAYNNLPGYKDAISESWDKTKASFVPVRVVSGNNVEATYLMPASIAEKLATDKNVSTAWITEGKKKYFNVDTRANGGKVIGKELHEAFTGATKDLYNDWYIQAAPKIASQIKAGEKAIGKAEDQLESSYATGTGQIANAQGQIDSATYKRQQEWQQLRDDYTKRKSSIAEIFSNFNVKEAK